MFGGWGYNNSGVPGVDSSAGSPLGGRAASAEPSRPLEEMEKAEQQVLPQESASSSNAADGRTAAASTSDSDDRVRAASCVGGEAARAASTSVQPGE